MNTSPISAKKHTEGAPIMDEDIDMETSTQVKQVDEGDEDEIMGADGGVYIVESILDYRTDFEDDETRYLVKWKGYDESEQTWELEDQFVGSRDVLEAYWEIIGGKPVQKTKRRGRPASGSVKKNLTVKSAADGSDEWLPPVPSAGNWDALVQDVETVDKDEKGALWAYLLWSEKKKDGGPIRNKAPVRTCYKACPQKMLKFYEKHLVLPKSKALQLLLSNTVQHPQINVVEPEGGLAEDVDELV